MRMPCNISTASLLSRLLRLALPIAVACAPAASHAGGFAIDDLSAVAQDAAKALGSGFTHRDEPRRITLICADCAGEPLIDILLGRQDDGTEARIRSGETPISRLEQICRDRSPDCRVTALSVAPAVGWISTYPMGSMAGSTAIVLRDGDMLTIRSLAGDPAVARRNVDILIKTLGPRIVGQ